MLATRLVEGEREIEITTSFERSLPVRRETADAIGRKSANRCEALRDDIIGEKSRLVPVGDLLVRGNGLVNNKEIIKGNKTKISLQFLNDIP